VKALLSYALSLAGFGLVVWAMLGAYVVNLSYPAARLRLMMLLRQNVNQAEIMCKAAKGTFYEPIAAAIKIGAMAQTTDLNIIGMSTKPGYDAAVTGVKMHWNTLFGRGKKGALLLAGGLVLAIIVKTSFVLHIILLVIAAGAAIWFVVTRAENERSLVRARAELLPELDRAFAEGRYVRYG
jgi:hypothetical protein